MRIGRRGEALRHPCRRSSRAYLDGQQAAGAGGGRCGRRPVRVEVAVEVLGRRRRVGGERRRVARVDLDLVVFELSEDAARAGPTCKWVQHISVAHPNWHVPQN